ncbi:MAG: DUF6677 family protein [Acidobacteriota bacterium]|nr:DUF6677 family protein [Acidobacteriota bacterium]
MGSPWIAAGLAWLCPGAGHFYLRRWGRGVFFLVVIFAAIYVGWRIQGGLPQGGAAPLERLATLGAMGMGLPYFILRFGLEYAGDLTRPAFEYGGAFLLGAGLMNLLLVLDAWDIATGRKP